MGVYWDMSPETEDENKPKLKERFTSNASYCRFRNTYEDLRECYSNMLNPENRYEETAKLKLIRLCQLIAQDYGHEVEVPRWSEVDKTKTPV